MYTCACICVLSKDLLRFVNYLYVSYSSVDIVQVNKFIYGPLKEERERGQERETERKGRKEKGTTPNDLSLAAG